MELGIFLRHILVGQLRTPGAGAVICKLVNFQLSFRQDVKRIPNRLRNKYSGCRSDVNKTCQEKRRNAMDSYHT